MDKSKKFTGLKETNNIHMDQVSAQLKQASLETLDLPSFLIDC